MEDHRNCQSLFVCLSVGLSRRSSVSLPKIQITRGVIHSTSIHLINNVMVMKCIFDETKRDALLAGQPIPSSGSCSGGTIIIIAIIIIM